MEIATTFNGDNFAVVRYEGEIEDFFGRVSIFSLQKLQKVGEFVARWGVGGKRLAISPDGKFCFVGCYYHGLSAFEIATGHELWRRRDLKPVQSLTCSTNSSAVDCCRVGPAYVLDSATGTTKEKLAGVADIFPNPFNDSALIVRRSLEYHTPIGTKVTAINRLTFAVLDAAFGPDSFAVAESRGPVRCFEPPTGERLWSYQPPRYSRKGQVVRKGGSRSHLLELSWSMSLRCYVGLEWPFSFGGPQRLLLIDATTGKLIARRSLGKKVGARFCQNGDLLIATDGTLTRVNTGKVIYRFKF